MPSPLVSRRNPLFQRRRFIFVVTAIAAFALLCVYQLSLAPSTWHSVLDYDLSNPDTQPHSNDSSAGLPTPAPLTHQPVDGGRLKVTMGGPHPLHGLIVDAEAKWNHMVARYHFARSVGFKLIDEFDQIDRDIKPLLALQHHILLRRIAAVSVEEHTYNLDIRDGNVTVGGKLADWVVASDFGELVSVFAKDLPDIKFYVSGHDMGPSILAEDMRLAVNTVLTQGRRLTEAQVTRFEDVERNPRRGVANACLRDPVTFYTSALPERNQHTHTFIRDHRASMSFCTNPAILNNPLKRHGYFAYDVPHPRSASPFFVQSQLSAGGAILHPALQDYTPREVYLRKFGEPVPWVNRTEKVFWRGRSTGEGFNHQHDWRFSHRVRLHVLANRNGNNIDPNVTPDVELLVEDREAGTVRLETHSREVLNERYMDVKMIGPPIQCEQSATDDTCRQMESALDWGELVGWEAGLDRKFLLDVVLVQDDFIRFMPDPSLSVVFKMTIFPEWNSDWLVPYYHYVPIQTDYSDLYDTLAFFMGAPGANQSLGHDDMAETIAAHAREFSAHYWRWEDMQVYVYRLLLEYARLLAYDRESMSM
ncbi:F-actin-capping protein subunit alpha [Ceratobasidium sp. 414]|nr:F-actin-capping protein subunit alpha [Ceratobasidium sp. 414]